jgi:hypothetical protein
VAPLAAKRNVQIDAERSIPLRWTLERGVEVPDSVSSPKGKRRIIGDEIIAH